MFPKDCCKVLGMKENMFNTLDTFKKMDGDYEGIHQIELMIQKERDAFDLYMDSEENWNEKSHQERTRKDWDNYHDCRLNWLNCVNLLKSLVSTHADLYPSFRVYRRIYSCDGTLC